MRHANSGHWLLGFLLATALLLPVGVAAQEASNTGEEETTAAQVDRQSRHRRFHRRARKYFRHERRQVQRDRRRYRHAVAEYAKDSPQAKRAGRKLRHDARQLKKARKKFTRRHRRLHRHHRRRQ